MGTIHTYGSTSSISSHKPCISRGDHNFYTLGKRISEKDDEASLEDFGHSGIVDYEDSGDEGKSGSTSGSRFLVDHSSHHTERINVIHTYTKGAAQLASDGRHVHCCHD